eukprot:25212_1
MDADENLVLDRAFYGMDDRFTYIYNFIFDELHVGTIIATNSIMSYGSYLGEGSESAYLNGTMAYYFNSQGWIKVIFKDTQSAMTLIVFTMLLIHLIQVIAVIFKLIHILLMFMVINNIFIMVLMMVMVTIICIVHINIETK